MKKLLFLLLLVPFLGFSQVIPAGDYVISNKNTRDAYPNFQKLTTAVNYLNLHGIGGNVRFLLDDALYDLSKGEIFPITIKQFSGSIKFTVTIKPNMGKVVSVNASTPYYNDPSAVFKLEGADNVIFDGSNAINGSNKDLTLYNTNPNPGNGTPRTVIWLASNNASDGANNNIIKNIILKQYHKGTSQISIGVFAGGASKVTDAAEASNSNVTVTNVDFTKVGAAIYVNGSTNDNSLSSNWIISDNIIGNTSSDNSLKPYVAVHFVNVKDYTVSNNVIDGLVRDESQDATSKNAALWIEGKSNGKIFNNKIANISNTLGDAYVDSRGIYINASNNLIYNNVISNVSSAKNYGTTLSSGIYIESGTNNKIYYNTIYQNSTTNVAAVSSCLYINNGSQADIRNNIFYNIGSGVNRYAVYSKVDKTVFTSINYNNYYAPTIGFLGGDKNTMADWKTATGKDVNSINVVPVFLSATDLHLNANQNNALKAGTLISGFTTDIDGDIRDTKTPYIGADEIVCKLTVPTILTTEPTCDAASTAKVTNYSSSNTYEFLPMGPSVGSGGLISGLTPGINYTVSAKNGICSSVASLSFSVASQTAVFNGSWSTPPAPNLSAIIQSEYRSKVNGKLNVCSLTITNNAAVTINKDTSFTVKNNIKVDAGSSLTVESDANLVQVNDNAASNLGNITVLRDIQIGAKRTEYNYLGSPVTFVAGQNLKTIYPGIAFTLYHIEANNLFGTSSGANIPGRGLAVKEPTIAGVPAGNTKVTATYTGVPQNGKITFPLAYSNTVTNTSLGYNLLANPYPSNIDLTKLYELNGGDRANGKASGNISATFYFWDNEVNTINVQQGSSYKGQAYAIFNAFAGSKGTGTKAAGYLSGTITGKKTPVQIINVGQGFMTKALVKDYTLVFNNSIRTDAEAAASFLGKSEDSNAEDDRFWLQLISPTQLTSTMAVVYFNGGNNAFGPEDSESKLGSDDIFSVVDDKKIAINGKSSFEDSDKIDLGIIPFQTGQYTIAAAEREGVFANGQNIYLKDKETGSVTNLSQGNYRFDVVAGETAGRFEIMYKPESVLVTDNKVKDGLVIYREAGDFVIKTNGEKISTVEIYETSGKLIGKLKPNSSKVIISSQSMTNGMYILNINQGGKISSRKILK